MVYGLDTFKQYFDGHTSKYVFIGGVACYILLDELGVTFRTTRDLDIVLVIEAIDASFGESFWRFIEDGGYEHCGKGVGDSQFYRFTRPTKPNFPHSIELFSRKPDGLHSRFGTQLTPIHIDSSVISLSAILLDDAYYELLKLGRRTVDGYSVIELETIILFKIKAWLDMKQRARNGETVDSSDIKKHRNDVFRLLANVPPSTRMNIATGIEADVRQFVEMIYSDRPDLKNLGIGSTFEDMITVLNNVYLGTEHSA